MTIDGFQPMTLLDFPNKVGCTVFLKGCNFRCPFCHNATLVELEREQSAPPLALEKFRDFLQRRQGLLDGVCVSGGEPLLNPQLPQLLELVKGLGYLVKVDTNGSFPQRLVELWKSGLVDYEFRTTVVRQFHDAQSFAQIGPWIAGAKRYYLQTFTHRATVLRPGLSAWDGETMEGFAAQMRPYVSHVEVR